MALPSTGAISLRDIYYEIYKAYPPAGTAINLEALINASNLTDKTRPHSMSQFRGYTHSSCPAAGTYSHTVCDVSTGYQVIEYYHNGSCGYISSNTGLRCDGAMT